MQLITNIKSNSWQTKQIQIKNSNVKEDEL